MFLFLFFIFFVVVLLEVMVLVSADWRMQTPQGNGQSPTDTPTDHLTGFGDHSAAIGNNYKTFGELQRALRSAGMETTSLILGVDFTRSNEWSGATSFGNRSLHAISHDGSFKNPYQIVMETMGMALQDLDPTGCIPTYGFGDTSTKDKTIFPFFPDRPCVNFSESLSRYTEIAPVVKLDGPTSFAPLIREAIRLVKERKSYHILLIIADGQITDESENSETVQAIVEASKCALSIVVVGVGDGPWDMMDEFDDGLPARRFDNFQFVEFNEIMHKHDGSPVKFATDALQEIPDQYRAIKKLGYLRQSTF